MKSICQFSVLNQGLSLHGDVILDHGVTCLGLVDGDLLSTQGLVHVGPSGNVRGKVEGEFVVIDGTVEGDVAARVSLVVNGVVKGAIHYAGTIRLGQNAHLDGKISRVAGLVGTTAAAEVQVAEPA